MIGRTKNISMIHIRNLTGYPSTDLGTLCKAPTINMWAKYKPVPYAFTSVRPTDWWRGSDNKCGIAYTIYPNVATLFDAANSNIVHYKHDFPKGGDSEPFRAGDFAGYNTDSKAPVYSIRIDATTTVEQGIKIYTNGLIVDANNLHITDVWSTSNFQELYLAAAIRKVGSETIQWMTGTENIVTSTALSFLTVTPSSTGIYDVVIFLSSVPKPELTGEVSGLFALMPDINGVGYVQRTEVKSSSVDVLLEAQFQDGYDKIKVRYGIRNNSSNTITIENPEYRIRYIGKKENDPFVNGEGVYTPPSIIVPPSSIVHSSYSTITGVLTEMDEYGYGGQVFFISNNGVHTGRTVIMMEQ